MFYTVTHFINVNPWIKHHNNNTAAAKKNKEKRRRIQNFPVFTAVTEIMVRVIRLMSALIRVELNGFIIMTFCDS